MKTGLIVENHANIISCCDINICAIKEGFAFQHVFSMFQLWRLDDMGARSLADPLLAHVNGHKGGQEMLIL